jgi:hypothetical protein
MYLYFPRVYSGRHHCVSISYPQPTVGVDVDRRTGVEGDIDGIHHEGESSRDFPALYTLSVVDDRAFPCR